MTISADDAAAPAVATDVCHFPGCTRPSRPDPATGRPAKYCEEVIDGVLHNRANAWHRRRANRAAGADEIAPAAAAPVSMARATLEERLTELPQRLAGFIEYLNGVVTEVHTAGDLDAAGAEVEDAHREALTKVAEADHRAAAAERARREAEARAADAETQRAEADAAAEDAIAETERTRTDFEQQLARVRAEAAAQVEAAERRAAAAEETARRADVDRDEQVQAAREDVLAARSAAAAAQAAREAAEQTAQRDQLVAAEARQAVERAREQAQAEREALRAEHAEHIRQLRQDAAERAAALSAALDVARGAALEYQAQLATGRAATAPGAKKTPAKKAAPQRGSRST